jgi:hypothetical protein
MNVDKICQKLYIVVVLGLGSGSQKNVEQNTAGLKTDDARPKKQQNMLRFWNL